MKTVSYECDVCKEMTGCSDADPQENWDAAKECKCLECFNIS